MPNFRGYKPRWDDEEILRGRQRNASGGFSRGLLQTRHPNDEHAEHIQRVLSEGLTLLRSNLPSAIRTLAEVCNDKNAPSAARVRAAELILDRVLGKAPQTVHITGTSPFEQLIAGIVLKSGAIEATAEEEATDGQSIIWDEDGEDG